jgi:hypothetical protein
MNPNSKQSPNPQSNWWYLRFKERMARNNSKQIETSVVGVTYENRQIAIAQLAEHEQVWLKREPQNPHDKNAIGVWRANGQKIGYLGREFAAPLASTFDRYAKPVPAIVIAVLGKNYSDAKLGVRLRFTIPEAGPEQPAIFDGDCSDHEDF